jgi:hypothetical protein
MATNQQQAPVVVRRGPSPALQKAMSSLEEKANRARDRVQKIISDKEGIESRGIAAGVGYVGGRYTGQWMAKRKKEGKSITIGKSSVTWPTAVGGAAVVGGILGVTDDPRLNMGLLGGGIGVLAGEGAVNAYLEELAKPVVPAGGAPGGLPPGGA